MRSLQALLTLSLMGAIAVYGYTHARTVIAQQLGSMVRQHNRELERAAADPDEPEVLSETPTLPAKVALPWEAPEEGWPLTGEAGAEIAQAPSASEGGPVGPADLASPPYSEAGPAAEAAPEAVAASEPGAQADPERYSPRPWVSSEPPVVSLPPEIAQLPPRAQAEAAPGGEERAQAPETEPEPYA